MLRTPHRQQWLNAEAGTDVIAVYCMDGSVNDAIYLWGRQVRDGEVRTWVQNTRDRRPGTTPPIDGLSQVPDDARQTARIVHMQYLFGRSAAAALILAAVSATPAVAAPSVSESCPPVTPSPSTTAEPYVQQLYGVARFASLANGTGVRVAVIDSGVDAANPQLKARGAVTAGRDFLRDADGRQDCNGHGTMVASIIAARPVDGVEFQGLAPGVTIVPIRVSEQSETATGATAGMTASPGKLAQAIDWAADPGGGNADVINLSLTLPRDVPVVRRSVSDALARGVVIVAAVGNDGAPERGNPTPYPAAYPGVIGVGAVDATGRILPFSGHGPYVDLVAPGDRITAAAPHKGHSELTGTSAAAPLVSAAAALILQRFPDLTPEQVARRLLATTDPSPAGRYSPRYGYGPLNPFRALTETVNPTARAPEVTATVLPPEPALTAEQQRRLRAQHTALWLAAAGAGALVLLLFGAVTFRRGRERGWRPGVSNNR